MKRKLMTKTALLVLALNLVLSLPFMAQSHPQSTQKSETVKIEIWSDIVCPFCFLGKKKVEQAIAKLEAEEKVEIVWHSFQLDPGFPLDSAVPCMENLSRRKGYPLAQVKGMCDNLTQAGKAYGIDFHFDKALTFNTKDAHRLIKWADTEGKSSELKEAFMLAYFTNGSDLSDPKNLLTVVETVGLDTEAAQKVLDSDTYTEEVDQDILRARELGIGGVPYFLVNGTLPISGAQPDQVFERVIERTLTNQ